MFEYAVHTKEVAGYFGPVENAPYMNEINKLIEEKALRGEEIILKHGKPAFSLYGEYTHLYSRSSGNCGLDWWENRVRYVRRFGHAPKWTGLLLTIADGQVCYAERVMQTLSGALSDKTVKALICLPFDVPPEFEFLFGPAFAVFRRIHRMILLGQIIDDDDEGLGDDGIQTILEIAEEGVEDGEDGTK